MEWQLTVLQSGDESILKCYGTGCLVVQCKGLFFKISHASCLHHYHSSVCVCVCVCVCVYSVGHVLKAQSIAKSFIVHFYCLKVSDPSLERYLVVTSSD